MRIIMNQEPLGVAPNFVMVNDLKRWSDTAPTHYLTDYSSIGETAKYTTSPFVFNPEINQKIVLWFVFM